MFLDESTLRIVIASTPLISIDFIVERKDGKVLLGNRLNRPAQGFWFVPGGRIQKNESIYDAFQRLSMAELGRTLTLADALLLGPYDHFYNDYVFGTEVSTHYLALAYHVKTAKLQQLPNSQHDSYHWFSVEELLLDDDVHKNTKSYFLKRTT